MFYVVAYDMPSAKRRAKLLKSLKGFGIHTQFSLFECDLDGNEYEKMMHSIYSIVNLHEDAVKVYRLCKSCITEVDVIGTGGLALEPDCVIV